MEVNKVLEGRDVWWRDVNTESALAVEISELVGRKYEHPNDVSW